MRASLKAGAVRDVRRLVAVGAAATPGPVLWIARIHPCRAGALPAQVGGLDLAGL